MKNNFRAPANTDLVCTNNQNVSREIISDFVCFPNLLTLS